MSKYLYISFSNCNLYDSFDLRLIQELIESQQAYQAVLKVFVEESKNQMQIITNICQDMHESKKNCIRYLKCTILFSSRMFFIYN